VPWKSDEWSAVSYDDAELLDIVCVTTTLVAANRPGTNPLYAVSVVASGGREMAGDVGVR
jgi:hypothetical protein